MHVCHPYGAAVERTCCSKIDKSFQLLTSRLNKGSMDCAAGDQQKGWSTQEVDGKVSSKLVNGGRMGGWQKGRLIRKDRKVCA